jgi:hypothetical protein
MVCLFQGTDTFWALKQGPQSSNGLFHMMQHVSHMIRHLYLPANVVSQGNHQGSDLQI